MDDEGTTSSRPRPGTTAARLLPTRFRRHDAAVRWAACAPRAVTEAVRLSGFVPAMRWPGHAEGERFPLGTSLAYGASIPGELFFLSSNRVVLACRM